MVPRYLDETPRPKVYSLMLFSKIGNRENNKKNTATTAAPIVVLPVAATAAVAVSYWSPPYPSVVG